MHDSYCEDKNQQHVGRRRRRRRNNRRAVAVTVEACWIFVVVVVVVVMMAAVEVSTGVSAFRQQLHPQSALITMRTPSRWKSSSRSSSSSSNSNNERNIDERGAAQAALERTAAHLEKLQRQSTHSSTRRQRQRQRQLLQRTDGKYDTSTAIADGGDSNEREDDDEDDDTESIDVDADGATATDDPLGREREFLEREYLRLPANLLKQKLHRRQLPGRGRKPDLARRLVRHELQEKYGSVKTGKEEQDYDYNDMDDDDDDGDDDGAILEGEDGEAIPIHNVPQSFAGLRLSESTAMALGRAGFRQPSPIQTAAIPLLAQRQSCLLHAATGSGKTIAYLLPIVEHLVANRNSDGIALVLTPTRELAAQVAGVASALLPPAMRDDDAAVRLVTRPANLMQNAQNVVMYVGSAKAIHQSLYGDKNSMPAPPTSKPEAMALIQRVDWIVLDEVDRLLGVAGKKNKNSNSKRHEKPAAVLVAAVARLTLGQAVTVGASATVGRPLKRELARCLGLPPADCPVVVRGIENGVDDNGADENEITGTATATSSTSTSNRAVTIPDTVRHCVVPVVDGSSPGKILTKAFAVVQALNSSNSKSNKNNANRKALLVLTRNFGISTSNAIGALKHFNCQPEPVDLLDALEAGVFDAEASTAAADVAESLMEAHRQVTGARGIGQSASTEDDNDTNTINKSGYLLVTGEDTVRGLHLDGLDCVVVAGRPNGPDEYTHICGRTGRQGAQGVCINIVADVDAAKLTAWERMLGVQFANCATVDQCVDFVDEQQ